MAITVAEIVAKIKSEGTDRFVSDMKRGESATESFGSRVSAMGSRLSGVGQRLTLGLTLPIAGFALASVNAASDLNEATTAATTTYGQAAGLIVGYSQDAAHAVGLSQAQYLSAATQLGVFGSAAGLTGDALATFGSDTIGAAADLASFYNAPVPEALEAIRSGLVGETEPLRRFGIMMSDAAVQQYALEQGIWDGVGAMTEQQKVLARQGYIMANMGAATGDFAETSGGLANQQRILRAELANLSAEMGQVLLPTALKLATGFRGLLDTLSKLSPEAKQVILVIAGIAAVAGPALLVLGAFASAIGAITALFATEAVAATAAGAATATAGEVATAGWAGFILPILGIVAAIGLLYVAYKKNFLGFADAVNYVAGKVADAFGVVIGFIQGVVDSFQRLRGAGLNPIQAAFGALSSAISRLGGGNRVVNAVAQAVAALGFAVNRLVGRVVPAVRKIIGGFRDLFRAIKAGDPSAMFDALRKILAGFGDALAAPQKAVGDFLKSINTGFAPLDDMLHSLGKVWTDWGRLIQEVFQGDFAGALDVGKRLLGHFVDYVGDLAKLIGVGLVAGFKAIPWADVGLAVLKGLVFLETIIPRSILAAFRAIDWGAVGAALLAGIQAAVGVAGQAVRLGLNLLVDLAGDALGLLGDAWAWLRGRLPALDALASGVSQAVSVVLDLVTDLTGDVVGWIGSAWDWLTDNVTLLRTLGAGVSRAIALLLTLTTNLASDLLDWAGDAWGWLKTKVNLLGLLAGGVAGVAVVTVTLAMTLLFGPFVAAAGAVAWLASKVPLLSDLFDGVSKGVRVTLELAKTIVFGVFGWLGDAADWLGDQVALIGDLWDGVKHGVEVSIDLVTGVISGAADLVQSVIDRIGTAAGWTWDAAKGAFSWSVDLVANVATGGGGAESGETGAGRGFGADAPTAGQLVGVTPADAGAAAALVRAAIANEFVGLRTDLTAIVGATGGDVLEEMGSWAPYARERGALLRSGYADELVGLRADTNTIVGATGGDLLEEMGSWITYARERASLLRAAVANEFVGLRGDVTSLMQAIYTAIDGRLSVLVNVAATRAGQIRAGIANQFVGLRGDVASIMGGIAGAVTGSLSGLAGSAGAAAYGVGSSIGQGIHAGMSAWLSSIAAGAANLVTAAINNARAAAGNPNSPSPVSRDRIGSPIGEGVYAGIMAWQARTADALADMVNMSSAGLGGMASSPVYQPVSVRGGFGGGTVNIIYMSRRELSELWETVDTVKVLTSPEEIRAQMGG